MRLRAAVSPLLAALALLGAVPAAASAASDVTASPAAGGAGTSVTLQGSGFRASRRVVVTIRGAAARAVRTSARGTFTLRLTVPRGTRGTLPIVSRSRRTRVTNRFVVKRRAGARDVMEIASSNGRRVRITPAAPRPGGKVRLVGAGFAKRQLVRIALPGRSRRVRTTRAGRFATTIRLSSSLPAGAAATRIDAGRTRLRVILVVSAPPPPPPPPPPPTNSALPTITGTARDGRTLTAHRGTWQTTGDATFATAWQRCDASGAACAPIDGATSSTYDVGPDDVDHTLRVAVTAQDSAGSTTATSDQTDVVRTNTVALWHMDETSGETMVDAIGGHDGDLTDVALGQPGFTGTGYGFNGKTSEVQVPNSGALNPGSADFTFTIYLNTTVRPPNSVEDWDLIRKGSGANPSQVKVEYYPSGKASCGVVGTAGEDQIIDGPALDDGQWHKIECVKTASSLTLRVDGASFSHSVRVGSVSNTSPVIIGTHPQLPEFFEGTLDEASISIG